MAKLQPLRPTTTQMKRLLSKQQPIGAGFLIYRENKDSVGVVEFKVSNTGVLTMLDGSPMVYTCKDDSIKHYKIIEFIPEDEK